MLSNEDLRDLNIYIKHFIIKICQSIVSSRTYIHKSDCHISNSTISSQFDWFNISIVENSLVTEQIKSLFNGKRIDLSNTIDVCIFINTFDSKLLLIEKWRILMVKKLEEIKSGWKVDFYNNLTSIIKSVLIVSRSNFIYRICKLSTNNGFSVSCEFQLNENENNDIAHDFNQQKIGVALCPVGTVEVYLYWKELEDFSMITSNEIVPNKAKIYSAESNTRNTVNYNRKGDINAHISLAYGGNNIGKSPSLNSGSIPFNNFLIHDAEKVPNLEPEDYGDIKTLNNKFESFQHNFQQSPEDFRTNNEICINQSSIFKTCSYSTNNIKTPFAYSKNDAQLFYQSCCDVPMLNIFKDTLKEPKNFELDDLLLTFRNNAKPFTNFINHLTNMDT